MTAIANGISLHGGFLPYTSTFLMFGEPKPMMVLHISRDGLSVTARASSTARLMDAAS